jgi:protein-S-isoprenylcysteine O-methyltransferase Ste14
VSDAPFTVVDAVLVVAGWVVLWVILSLRPRGEPGPEKRRDRRSLLGMVLQGIGFGIAWGVRRSLVPEAWTASPGSLARTGTVAALLIASLWLVFAAVQKLGKQWSLTARVLESHRLVTEGPYRFVRHPIYTAMLGLLLATGVAMSRGPAILAAVVIYILGTRLRIGVEERLLRDAFGPEYDAYARRVGGFIPRPSRG